MNNYNDTMDKPHVTPAQWEQRRYEIAKAMLPTIYNLNFSNERFEELVDSGIDEEHPEFLDVICEYSLEMADALIKQLKGGEE